MMKKISFICLWLTVNMALSLVYAANNPKPPEGSEIISKISVWTQSWEKTAFEFSQVSLVPSVGVTQTAQGLVWVKKPWIRWEYQKPESYYLLTNGDRVWMVMPNDKQVLTESMQEMKLERIPVLFLKDIKPLLSAYMCTKVSAAGGDTKDVELKKKDEDLQAKTVILHVLPNGCVDGVKLIMNDDTSNSFTFTNFKGGDSINDELFSIVIPDDYAVVNFQGEPVPREVLAELTNKK